MDTGGSCQVYPKAAGIESEAAVVHGAGTHLICSHLHLTPLPPPPPRSLSAPWFFQSPPARHSHVLSLAHVHQTPLQSPPLPPLPPPPPRVSVQDCDLCEDMIPSMREAERLTGRKIRTFNVGATTADYELFRGLDEGEW